MKRYLFVPVTDNGACHRQFTDNLKNNPVILNIYVDYIAVL